MISTDVVLVSLLNVDSSKVDFYDLIQILLLAPFIIGGVISLIGKLMDAEKAQIIGFALAYSPILICIAPFYLIITFVRNKGKIRAFFLFQQERNHKKNEDLQSKVNKLEWENKKILNELQDIKSDSEKLKSKNVALASLENEIFKKKEELNKLEINIRDKKKAFEEKKNELDNEIKTKKRELDKINKKTHEAEKCFEELKTRLSGFKSLLAQKNEYSVVVSESFDFKRMGKALEISPLSIQSLTVTASVISEGVAEPYITTLTSCTCYDFKYRHTVCKHMYALAFYSGCLSCEDKSKFKEQLARMCERAELIKKEREGIDHLIRAKSSEFPMLASMIAEFYKEYDDILAYGMATKKPAALKASEAISIVSKEKTKFIARAKRSENLLTYLYASVPWLEEYIALPPFRETVRSGAIVETEEDNEYTPVKLWLSHDEFYSHSPAERNQLVLDRYLARSNKTNWEVGIEYEQYIGYLCEVRGYTVQYRGAIDGFDDMGRDLIVEKNKTVYIVQCKRWHESKIIHEKHIFQLFGSVTEYKYENPNSDCVGIFVTSSSLSDRARDIAKILNIEVYQNIQFQNDYPRIKCNVSDNGKIYHFPFDQQYNSIKIKPELGELYAFTVLEAENLGFRRAMRHRLKG